MNKLFNSHRRARIARHRKLFGNLIIAFLIIGYFAYAAFFQFNDTQFAAAKSENRVLTADDSHRLAVVTTSRIAEKMHYGKPTLNNQTSKVILDRYLDTLDPQKIYLLQSDVKEFQSNQYYFDDFLNNGNLNEVFEIFKRYRQRVEERAGFATSLIDYRFDFGLFDELKNDRSDAEWSRSQAENDWLWKRLVKDDILTLKLEGNDEGSIAETLESRYARVQQSVSQYKADDVTEIFINAYLNELDPYSEYFSPRSTDDFEISLSQQIEGIGAMLRRDNEYTTVHSVITGGPAARSNKIHPGDRIIAVRNNNTNEYQDIVGWRLADVVNLIRGPKGTTVYLKILPNDSLPGAAPEEIAIVREKVKLEEQMAKKSTVEFDADGKLLQLGIISLPTFYSALFAEKDQETFKSSSKDVAEILQQLNKQNVDGIVIDLRGNGGGALTEAVDLTSLFIESGPIVQVKNFDGKLEVKTDSDDKITYDGPLVVLVDRRSASASEIFAGAMQDYKRGVIIGETTFGKGMLQSVWPLGKIIKQDNAGSLKLSTAQFYRVNGSSTQHIGVVPDILFATDEFAQISGERAFENALPTGVISPARSVVPWRNARYIEQRIPELRRLNQDRTKLNPIFAYILETERYNRHRLNQMNIYLNEEKRQTVLEIDRQAELANLNKLRTALGLEVATELNEDAFPSKQVGDAYLDEALNVLADLITHNSLNHWQASISE